MYRLWSTWNYQFLWINQKTCGTLFSMCSCMNISNIFRIHTHWFMKNVSFIISARHHKLDYTTIIILKNPKVKSKLLKTPRLHLKTPGSGYSLPRTDSLSPWRVDITVTMISPGLYRKLSCNPLAELTLFTKDQEYICIDIRIVFI